MICFFSRGYFTSSVSFTFALFRHLYSWYFIYSVFLNIFKSNFFSSFKTFVSSVLLGNEIDIYCKTLMFWHYLQHFLKRFSRFIHYLMRNSFRNIKFLPRWMLWKHLYPDCTHTCTHISPVVAKFEASTFSEVLCVYTYMCVFMCKFVFLWLCVCVHDGSW